MPTEIFGSAVIHNICAMLERALQVRTHHGVIDDDDSIGGAFLDISSYAGKIDYFEQRVSWTLEENHSGLFRINVRKKSVRFGGVYMMYGDAAVCLEISEDAVSTAVKVISRDDFITGLEHTQDRVEGGHARRYNKSMSSR